MVQDVIHLVFHYYLYSYPPRLLCSLGKEIQYIDSSFPISLFPNTFTFTRVEIFPSIILS